MTLYPDDYGTAEVTLQQMKAKHGPKMHPEFARRFFAYIESQGGRMGVGGGWRAVQPVKPGFAPPGKSFHESQTFASGITAYAAVDLVFRQPGQKHRAPTWAETDSAKDYALHTFVKGEPWHIQCIEMRGYGTWLAAGRPDPLRVPIPGDTPPPPPPTTPGDDRMYLIPPPPERTGGRWLVRTACGYMLASSHDITDGLPQRPFTDDYRVQQYDDALAVASNRQVPA